MVDLDAGWWQEVKRPELEGELEVVQIGPKID